MAVVAVVLDEVQVHQRVRRHRLPELLHELRVELADFFGGERRLIHEHGPAAQVEGGRHQRFFHRQNHRAVPRDSLLIADHFENRFAETDADVFDGVMIIDVQIPVGFDRQIEQAMLGEQREHVVEEPDAGADV